MGLTPMEREAIRQRAADEEARKQLIARNKPSWDRARAERELASLVNEVVASKNGPSAEHRATYERLQGGLK